MLPSPLRLWVGYADGSPVGAAASYVAHGLHVLALGVVLAAARRRGHRQALLRAAGRPGRATIGGPVQRHEPPRGRTQRLSAGHPLHAVATSPVVTPGGTAGHGAAL